LTAKSPASATEALAELHAQMALEAQARDRKMETWHADLMYDYHWWQAYGEPWRLSVTWISNFDTTAGRAFLNRKE